ncbi:Type II secretion system (T2SS), protein F [Desulfotomaculum arcticum]|uniref:Type II secretion system (T2SS), protein F n=1 Tax=Desulfotruncus arcticus DSM 17038 TaxID=1121424 RepID=A0A1I2Z9P8_9FIRM|nr:type II secretion system F family protein [Desulfotruncus arcticus]SFH34226.1 Type II secretion system (T2SS), protein F [Desulfotomaculum arcticum] [Desulfotruncus arcticus DSM 17038]
MDTAMMTATLAATSVLVGVAGRRFNLPGGMKLKGNSEEILLRTGNRFSNELTKSLLKQRIVQADLDNMEPEYLVGLQIALPVLLLAVFLPFMLAGLIDIYWVILPTIFLYFLPRIWINKKAEQRVKAIRADVPDFCDLLSSAMESGADLLMAAEEVASSMKGELTKEINKTLSDIVTGDSKAVAFNKLAARCGVPELSGLVRKINQAIRYGGEKLPEMVKHQADKIRLQKRHKAQQVAGELVIKLLLPMIVFFLGPLICFLLFPVMWHLWFAFG